MTSQQFADCQAWLARRFSSESGVALILVLAMLTIMSLLGAMVLSTSTTEIGISSNYRTSREAFFAAERAVEYAMGNETIVKATGTTNLELNPHLANLTVANAGVTTTLDVAGADNTVINFGPGELPVRLRKIYGGKFGANYYLITVTGARVDGGGNVLSTARIETQRVRLYPKEDDTKLFTSSEG